MQAAPQTQAAAETTGPEQPLGTTRLGREELGAVTVGVGVLEGGARSV